MDYAPGMRVCFVSASGQNVFFGELMGAFQAELQAQGVETLRSVDMFPPAQDDLVYVFVPHEYMGMVEPASHPDPGQLARTVALCTEQPGTHWFEHAAEIAGRAGGAVDINVLGVRELRRRGVRAAHVPLGYVPAWDHWHGEERDRSTDLMFLGGYTDRRARALSTFGRVLQDRKVDLRVADSILPHTADDPHFLAGERKWRALADTHVLLNIHRDPLGYMEWQRVLEAMCNGCVVLTEHSVAYDPLVPGEDFFSADIDRLHLTAAALLDDPDLRHAARYAAYAKIRNELPMSAAVAPLLEVLERAAKAPVQPPRPGAPVPRARPVKPVLPIPHHLTDQRTELDPVRMGIKHLVVESMTLRREIAQLRGEVHDTADTLEYFGDYHRATPAVSVAVTVYNYAEYVGAALASVGRNHGVPFEIVVIDDASRDASVERIRESLKSMPWVPSVLVRRGVNQGLAAARNAAVKLARGEFVQILDADNELYPHDLRELAAVLQARPDAAFAYGAIEVFDHHGPRDIMSWRPWDASRLTYGNYVDAMAMIRRDRLLEVGGYTSQGALHGWEDFALWCALADAGYEGVGVSSIVARYRVGLNSMISMSNIDSSAAWGALVRLYPWLVPTAAQ